MSWWRSAGRFARLLALVPSMLLGATPLAAQTDVIRGRVTNPEGLPLPGVRVTATSIPGNVTREARTSDQGGFQLALPGGTGDYMMGYALVPVRRPRRAAIPPTPLPRCCGTGCWCRCRPARRRPRRRSGRPASTLDVHRRKGGPGELRVAVDGIDVVNANRPWYPTPRSVIARVRAYLSDMQAAGPPPFPGA